MNFFYGAYYDGTEITKGGIDYELFGFPLTNGATSQMVGWLSACVLVALGILF